MKVGLVLVLAMALDADSTWSDLRASLEQRVGRELEVARRTASAEESYRNGVRLLREGNRAGAEARFTQAEAAVLEAGEDLYFGTSLRDYLHELRAKVAREIPAQSARIRTTAWTQDAPETLLDPRTRAWLFAALRRAAPLESSLRNIFRSEGLPEELIYVGLVESGYRADAVSTAGAVGPWQFMPETARRYGLRYWKKTDERRDLGKATRAAARYLRDLHELLGDWTLAIAAFNAGEFRVLRAARTAGGQDFWSVRHLLPQETADYVPRVLAAIRMARSLSRGESGT